MEKRKKMFANSFSTVSLVIILSVKLIMVLIFYNHFRHVVTDLTEFNAKKNVLHSQDLIVSILKEYEQALVHASVGVVNLLKLQGENPRTSGSDVVSGYLSDVSKKMPHNLDIYFTSNNVWNQADGFAAFATGWIPADDWDNTSRPWFTGAKNAKGKIAYSEPYVDSDSGNIVVTLSMTVFDDTRDTGTSLGVIAQDVTVNHLGDIINSMKSYSDQEYYIINAEGLFITNEDINSIMVKNIFTERDLELYRESILNSSNFHKFDKKYYIYSSLIPQTEWYVVSLIPAYFIFARVNSFIFWLFIFTVVMFLCVAVIIIVFAHRSITVPLKNVLKFTESLVKKEYDVNIPEFRDDELGDIQQSLIKIRDNLKSNIDSLHSHINNG